ncbi:Maltoporin (maltose/maltodextrin high-affinity receptor, phage lambda receptor protein) [Rubrivivax sp. A210]|uniref:carbohydrate porin n=1 Tax=Rubrivivax sp. A210 TaxID=2772301 RepID=UPI00191A45B6|nr:carbohydrate porin [Rubrivivax sp. A210]CAD5366228.1 Maltoporin (maltose/maltodextrin high-affinity receptor, phage lambda receptor protein) [Rubrivivax sp. A210]
MKFRTTFLAAAALSVLSTAASAVDWGGYTRIGPGQKSTCYNGGGASGFGSQAPGHGGIGRLGNECETYGEFALSQGMDAGGVNYKALLMTNFFSSGSTPLRNTDPTGGNNDNTPRIAQLYVEGKGFDVMPNANFWVGRRFYHRADVHWDDSFYVMGGLQGSTGAGVDGISVGGGSLGVAIFRSPDEASVTNAGTLINIDLQGISVNPGGKLRATLSFSKFGGTGGENGSGLSLQHNQSIFGGENTLWVQYSQGSTWLDMGFAGATDDSSKKRWRIADSFALLNGPLTAQTLIHYGEVDADTNGKKAKTFSLGGRVAYAFTKNFKLQGEVGYATTKNELTGNNNENVTKFTIAPTLTVGPNYYDRPELRFYVTQYSMNENYRLANGAAKKNKTAFGFQAEIWF